MRYSQLFLVAAMATLAVKAVQELSDFLVVDGASVDVYRTRKFARRLGKSQAHVPKRSYRHDFGDMVDVAP